MNEELVLMNGNIEAIREIIVDIITRRNNAVEPGVHADFITVVHGIRFFSLTSSDYVKEVWGGIRINASLTDFIMDCTREFLLRCFNDVYQYKNLCIDISNVYKIVGSSNSLIDEDYLSGIPLAKQIDEILIGNPWFVFLYMCEELMDLGDGDDTP